MSAPAPHREAVRAMVTIEPEFYIRPHGEGAFTLILAARAEPATRATLQVLLTKPELILWRNQSCIRLVGLEAAALTLARCAFRADIIEMDMKTRAVRHHYRPHLSIEDVTVAA